MTGLKLVLIMTALFIGYFLILCLDNKKLENGKVSEVKKVGTEALREMFEDIELGDSFKEIKEGFMNMPYVADMELLYEGRMSDGGVLKKCRWGLYSKKYNIDKLKDIGIICSFENNKLVSKEQKGIY